MLFKTLAAFTLALTCTDPALAQVKVITSGGFATAYRELLPEFERTTGISVTTGSGASQGNGPETIAAQLRRRVPADVVILSREGLNELIAEGMIVAGSDVNLAQTPLGIAVRSGAPKPNLNGADTFKQLLLSAKIIAVGGSTSGIYLTNRVLPRLGVPSNAIRTTARGAQATALVAAGQADVALLPVSEILNVEGVELAGTVPPEFQFISVFAAAIVKGSGQVDASEQLIHFMTSAKALEAIQNAGMESPKPQQQGPQPQ